MNARASAIEPLDRAAILDGMPPAARARLAGLDILGEIESTQIALSRIDAGDRHGRAVLAESQTGGRGRHGRQWHSPSGRNIYLSLGWHFEARKDFVCLPLAAAVGIAQAIAGLGLTGLGLKWPNDLVLDGEKLGGCLVETVPEGSGYVAMVGVGVNVHMSGSAGTGSIGQAWTELGAHLDGVSRNAVAARLLDALPEALERFARDGFDPFRRSWNALDVLDGKPVALQRNGERLEGIARGIGANGGLLLEREGELAELAAGEVTTWGV